MRVALVGLLLTVPVAAAMEFQTPANISGTQQWNGASWAFWAADSNAQVQILDGAKVSELNTTLSMASFAGPSGTAGADDLVVESEQTNRQYFMSAATLFAQQKARMFFSGDIRITSWVGAGEIHHPKHGPSIEDSLGPDSNNDGEHHLWRDALPQDGLRLVMRVHNFTFNAVNVSQVSLSDWEVQCPTVCPRGGGHWGATNISVPNMATLESHKYSREQLTLHNVTLSGSGSGTLFLGGDELFGAIEGQGRFPRATGAEPCSSCDGIGTLTASGRFELFNLRPERDDRVGADLVVASGSFKQDETLLAIVDPGTGASLAAITVAAVLAKVAFSLVTARAIKEPLANPKRKRLYDVVLQSPGATFRELVRLSSVPAGTARHHLTILARSGLIVEHGHKSTRRFFENHGRFDGRWQQVVALREPDLQCLHDLVVQQARPLSQRDIIDLTAAWGWSRSTTQHRLSRLVAHGALHLRLQGRLKMYSTQPPAVGQTPRPMWAALSGTRIA